ncbi:hypothetical protein ACWDKQ_22315 [Saccharopolyspora sp. NPDC000995]
MSSVLPGANPGSHLPVTAGFGVGAGGFSAPAEVAQDGGIGAHRGLVLLRGWRGGARESHSPGLTGSCDLYDADPAAVVDHKVVGPTSMKE